VAAFLFSSLIADKEFTVKNNKDATPPVKKALSFVKNHKKFIISAVVIAVLAWALFIPSSGNSQNSTFDNPDYEKVDVTGLTVQEACKKIKEKGWSTIKVDGAYGDYIVRDSNCEDEHIAEYANYTNKDDDFGLDSTATIVFTIQDESELTSSEKAEYKSLSNDSPESSSSVSKNDSVKSKNNAPKSSREFVTGGNGTDDTTIAKVESSALDGGLCRFKQAPERVINVDQVGTSATTEFINMGIALFKRSTCKQFTYQLALLTDDGRGNKSRNVVLQFNTKKSQFQNYNWQSLEGRVVGTQLKNDGIITMVNTDIGLNPNKFELYSLN